MKTTARITAVFLMIGAVCSVIRGQQKSANLSYENYNHIDYGPLKVGHISGVARDEQGVAVPSATVILFTETGHRLVTTTETDSEGAFKLPTVPSGKYRLLVKYLGFCAANIPLVVKGNNSKPKILVHLMGRGIDSCSYGELEH